MYHLGLILASLCLPQTPSLHRSIHSKKCTPLSAPLTLFPLDFLNNFIFTICHFTHISNSSFSTGTVPNCCKNAIIQPLLNKPGLNSIDFNNFSPTSKLPVFEKVLEKIVASQL